MIPAYLNDLCLDQVFAAFCGNVDDYLLESSKDEHVVDSETLKITGFVTPAFGQAEELADKFFEVMNPTGLPYTLMQIDNGIISSGGETKRCDCAIANKDKLSFVEFKANAISISNKAVKKNYKKAMKQLLITIDIIDGGLVSLGKSLKALRAVDAYVCFRKGYPRMTTSEMNYQVDFAAKTGGTPLSFNSFMSL